jgi:hypothetical protein
MAVKISKLTILFFLFLVILPTVLSDININSLNENYYSYQDELTLNFLLNNETLITNTSTTCTINLINKLGEQTESSLLYDDPFFYITYDTSTITNPTTYNYVVNCEKNSKDYIYSSFFTINDTGDSENYNFLALLLFFILTITLSLFIPFKLINSEEDNKLEKGIKFFGVGFALLELISLSYLIYAYVMNYSIHNIIRIHNIYIIIIPICLILGIGFLLLLKLANPNEEDQEENNKKWQ